MWQIKGNQKAATLLQKNLQEGNIPHAYLFVGPAHVGKLTTATLFAKTLNCTSTNIPCGQCNSCLRIESGKHTDLQIIESFSGETESGRQRSTIGLDTIKEIHKSAFLPPYEGKYKVYIFKEAERLTSEAANRFLKVLEEPPPYIVFILLTERERTVLPTIVSRCQKIYLRPMPIIQVKDLLLKKGIAEESAELISRVSGGCIGWALSAIEDEYYLSERKTNISEFLFLISSSIEQILEYTEHLAREIKSNYKNPYIKLDLWLCLFRDMLFLHYSCDDLITNIDFAEELKKLSRRYTIKEIINLINYIINIRQQLDMNINVRFLFETLLLKVSNIM